MCVRLGFNNLVLIDNSETVMAKLKEKLKTLTKEKLNVYLLVCDMSLK
jgi:hypothetical protein